MSFIGKAIGSITGANQQAKAGVQAGEIQADAAQAGIDSQEKMFAAIQALLAPYVSGGTPAFGDQLDLAGVNGNKAQAGAINGIQSSPAFTSALQQGENSILQNASATGGLRGGNTQAALGQFSPQLLAQAINDQFSRLGGLATIGQNAAAGTGTAGQNSTNAVSSLLQQMGAAQAGGTLAAGSAGRNAFGDILKIATVASGF